MDLSTIKDKLKDELEVLEEKRIRYLKMNGLYRNGTILIVVTALVIFFLLISVGEAKIIGLQTKVLAFITVFLIGLTEKKILSNKSDFSRHFKGKVFRRVLQKVYPTLKLNSKDLHAAKKLAFSKIFHPSYIYNSDSELISGVIGKTKIELSHVHVEKQSGKHNTTIFRGLLFVADFHKKFKGETFVLPDKLEAQFGSLGKRFQKMNSARDELVYFENVDFEREFVVYSNDQVEARYILSTSLIDRIYQIKQRKPSSKMYLSFIRSKVFVAIEQEKFLDVNMNISVYDNQVIHFLLDEIAAYISLVDELNLNTRIWSKQ